VREDCRTQAKQVPVLTSANRSFHCLISVVLFDESDFPFPTAPAAEPFFSLELGLGRSITRESCAPRAMLFLNVPLYRYCVCLLFSVIII